MIKREICDFKIRIQDAEDLPCRVPFSVYSALSDIGISAEGMADKSVTLTALLPVENIGASGENIFLRLYDIHGGCEISVNGTSLGSVSREYRMLTYDIKGLLMQGINTLEIKPGKGCAASAGVFRAAEIIKTHYAIIENISVTEKHEDGRVTVGLKVDTLGSSDNVRAVATLVSGAGQIYYGGLTKGRGSITVNDPLYWWPRGLGVQNLYKLTVNLYGDMEVEDTREMRLGLRQLTTAKSADGSLLEVNGISFVPMGATYRASAKESPRDAEKILEAHIGAAARSGFNTLVIPSDAAFPNERFFELCDAYGIVAIRECADLDADEALLRYSSYHPSVGIVDIVGAGDNIGLAAETLHHINGKFEFSAEDEPTDYHSEPSLPTYKTLCRLVPKGERNLFSETVETAADGRAVDMIAAVTERYLYPGDIYDFAYASALTQAELAEERVIKARKARGGCGRAVISSLGEDGGLISDAALDALARPKALQYRAAGFFAPVAVFAEANGLSVDFTVSNETRRNFIGTLEYRILNAKNKVIYRGEEPCVVEHSASRRLLVRDFSEWVFGHEREYYLEYAVKEGTGTVSCGTLLFVAPKRFGFIDPDIKAQIAGSDRRFTITLTASAYARGVEIDFENTDAVFHNNYVDLTTDAPVKISFNVIGAVTTQEYLMSELRIRSVYDIGNKRQ